MTLLTIPRDEIRDGVQPGDVLQAIDGRPLPRPLTVADRPWEMAGAVRLVNPLNTPTVWNLYPDTQVRDSVTVDRLTGAERVSRVVDYLATREDAMDAWANNGGLPYVGPPAEPAPEPEPTPEPDALDDALDATVREMRGEILAAYRSALASLPALTADDKRRIRKWSHYVHNVRVLNPDGRDTDLRSIYSATHDHRGQPVTNRRYSDAGTWSHIFGQIASHHGWCQWVAPYVYRLTPAGKAAIAYDAVAPYDQAEQKIEALAKAVHSGAANGTTLVTRAGKIADTLDALDEPDLAARLRTALTTRGEGLGLRYERVMAILTDFRAVSR